MPVFSFTAPHITPEEEKRERESLSDEYKKQLEQDLYGWNDEGGIPEDSCAAGEEEDESDDPDNLEKLMQEMEEVIENAPKLRKKDYLEAKDKAPQLLATEADPIKFLRCEKFDVPVAATRMLLYWKTRRKLFGEEKAYLPLTLSGAMAEEIEMIESGILAVLPKDDRGRGVLFLDRIRAVPPLATRDSVLRTLFYLLHVMAEQTDLQKKGFVILLNLKGYDLYKHFDRILTKQNSLLMLECMPIKIKAEHLLTGSANGVMSLVLPVRKHVVAKEIRLRMIVHTGTDEKILESFKAYGLTSKNIGHVSGGDFKHDDFLDWLDARRDVEEQREQLDRSTNECVESVANL